MDTYTCVDCEQRKPKSDFAPNKAKKSGIQSRCKLCYATYQREYYRNRVKTDETYRLHKRQWRKERAQRLAKLNGNKLRKYLESHPCIKCGEQDPVVLTFDHRDRTTKLFNISEKALTRDWEYVLQEIEKCDVLCANCHMRKTAIQLGWYKYLTI